MKIYSFGSGSLNEQDRLQLATLLIKAGYTVKICKEKVVGKNTYRQVIEYTEGIDG